jgi:hypothetical protein
VRHCCGTSAVSGPIVLAADGDDVDDDERGASVAILFESASLITS